MQLLIIYIYWLQIFANIIAVALLFRIARMKDSPSLPWYLFATAMLLALIYRVIKLVTKIHYLPVTFFSTFADVFISPLVIFLIMITAVIFYRKFKDIS